jgi:diketogulonate reductase-like aldo/keto reductase
MNSAVPPPVVERAPPGIRACCRVLQVEARPYLPETALLEFCKKNDIVLLAFAHWGTE